MLPSPCGSGVRSWSAGHGPLFELGAKYLVERSDLFLDWVKPFNAEEFNYERIRKRHICTQPMFIAKSIYSPFLFSDLSFISIYIRRVNTLFEWTKADAIFQVNMLALW